MNEMEREWREWCAVMRYKGFFEHKEFNPINRKWDTRMPNDRDFTTTDYSAYRCVAYKPEEGGEVVEKTIVSSSKTTARDLFVIELGADKVKEGWRVEVFPVA